MIMAEAMRREDFDCEELDKQLAEQISEKQKALEGLKAKREKIGNPKELVESISQIVWEQFILQIAGNAGQDFINQNHDLNLSLKRADHFLNPDTFVNGEMPSHNFDYHDKYQERYEEWKTNFKDNDPSKGIKRDPFDKGRPTGSASMAKDHTVPVSEIIRDKDMAAYVSQKDKVKFANGPSNLNDLDSAANSSKGDKTMSDWLNSERNGQKPEERFNLDRKELEKRDADARKKEQELIDDGKTIAEQEGRASRRTETSRAAGITTQAIAIALLAKLTRTVFQELIVWLAEKNYKASLLIEHVKKAINDFFLDFKNNVLLSVDVGLTVVFTQIFGEIVPMIRKSLLFFKVGGECVYKVGRYLNDPKNANLSTDIKVLEIGKIVTVSFTTAGGIGLGMALTSIIETYCPPLNVRIPLLGSAAGLIGVFLGGMTSGVCGAIVLHQIDGALERKKLSENTAQTMAVQDEVGIILNQQFTLYSLMINSSESKNAGEMKSRHLKAIEDMRECKNTLNEEKISENEEKLNNIGNNIDDWDI